MSGRLQAVGALLVAASVIIAGVVAGKVGPRQPKAAPSPWAGSGAWFCPHGGGAGWLVTLDLANPGDHPVTARVTSLGDPKGPAPRTISVPARSDVAVSVPGTSLGSASMVEYFGGWIAAGWTDVAGGAQSGMASDACASSAGRSIVLPFGTTVRGSSSYAVVMNPFGESAVFTMSVYSPSQKPTTTRDLTDFLLKPGASTAVALGPVLLGQNVAAASIQVSSGRVAAGSLVISGTAGIATAPGVPVPAPSRVVLPGDSDSGQAQLMVVNVSSSPAQLSATLDTGTSQVALAGVQGQQLDPSAAKSYQVSQIGPATIDFRSSGGQVAVALVDTSSSGDPGATTGIASLGGRWVVLPSPGAPPVEQRIVVADPGSAAATVTLTPLLSPGSAPAQPITLQVPAGRTVLVPGTFTAAYPSAAVLIRSNGAGVVAGSSSYSSNRADYSLAAGVPVPGN